MIVFTEADVLAYFPEKEVIKARPYARNAVLDAHWENGLLYGKVKGNSRIPYSLNVKVTRQKDRVTFTGYCSCPVGYGCKHMVAVALFEAQRQRLEGNGLPAPDHPEQVASRIAPMSSAQDKVKLENAIAERQYFDALYRETKTLLQNLPPETAPSEEGALWVLKQEGSQFLLEPFKTRRAKDGQWSNRRSKISDINRYNESYGYFSRPSFLSDFDLEIARLFKAATGRGTSNHFYLTGSMGDLIIRKLLVVNRLYVERRDPEMAITKQGMAIPLSMQAPVEVSFSWQENDRQQWALVSDLTPALATLPMIPTHPPFLMEDDGKSDSCHLIPLMTPFPPPILSQLLTPMWLAKEVAYDYWSPLYDVFPQLPPMPTLFKATIETYPPVANLTLAFAQIRAVTHLSPPLLAALTIDYGGYVFCPAHPDDPDIVRIDTGVERKMLQRDLAFEQHAVFTLINIGLRFWPVPNADAELFVPDQASLSHVGARDWLPHLQAFEQLRAEGWQIHLEATGLDHIDISQGVRVDLLDDATDFALDATINTDAGTFAVLPLLLDYLQHDKSLPSEGDIYLEKPSGGFVQVPVAQLHPILQAITELYDRPINPDGQLRLTQFDVMGLNSNIVKVKGKHAQAVRQLVSQLATVTGVDAIEPPIALQATLRDYQQQGLNWLHFLTKHNLGGVLADDMGLGKTLQVIAHLLKQKELGLLTKPALVIAPTSVVGNWMSELAKFSPSLSALRFDGAVRADLKDQIETSHVILTSYALIQRDSDFWQQIPLHSVIVDEAQYVKNPKAKTAQVIRTLKAEHCLCLTGTPLENHLGELWSLFDFVMPGFLATETQFKKRYRTPIEQRGDQACQNRLAQRVSPFMLRRTKAEVVTELPAKTEIIQRVTLEKAQWQLYSSVRLSMEKRVRELMAEKGLKRSHIEILDALLKLRQVCCDPSLVKIPAAEKVKHSAKLEVLVEMVQELTEEGRKILVFSQFATMLGIIEKRLNSEGIVTSKLTGATRNRQASIDAFVEGGAQVFLISLKAGGVGLNLTAADTVIHYDPWWNPAAESQATDRAYRIGQDKPVFVYKLIVENTVEEKILVMQDKKRALADSVFGDEDALSVWTDSATILNLFTED